MNFILRDFILEEDLAPFHKVHSDENSMQFYGMEPATNIIESRDLMKTYFMAIKQGNMIHQVIADATTHEYVGEIVEVGENVFYNKPRVSPTFCTEKHP